MRSSILAAYAVAAIAAAPATAEVTFDRYDVATGAAIRQTVLTGFLLDGPIADLAVLSIDRRGERHLRIYASGESTWEEKLDARLRTGVLFVDVANIGGRDRLLTYEPGRLSWFDTDSGSEHPLVAVSCSFRPPRGDEIPHVDITRDVNGDGLDDLVVPQLDGFSVSIQTIGGLFADPLRIGTAADEPVRPASDAGYRFNPWDHGRIHEVDYNRDGRSDLVFWNRDRFEVHLQDRNGLFDTPAETFTTDVAFDSDDIDSLSAPYRAKGSSGGDTPRNVLHTVADLNGDGVADLAVFSLAGGSLFGMHSSYEVHLGAPTPEGGTRFAPEASTVAPSDGIPLRTLSGRSDAPGIRRLAPGHDGQTVMMFTTMSSGGFSAIGKVVDALFTRSVALNLDFYRMEAGRYPRKPNAGRQTRVYARGKAGRHTSFLPAVLIGDVNGDRYPDLLVGRGADELHVFPGVPGSELFARRPQKLAVGMPSDEYTWLADLNQDGKQDVLMHHRSAGEPDRLTLLIAR